MPDLLTVTNLSRRLWRSHRAEGRHLFQMAEGQAVALLGRNGMGKTTLVNSIVGVTRHSGGSISLDGQDITRLRPDQRAHAGIGWVPQERNIFRSLTVEENMTAIARPGPWTLEKIYGVFPRLAERRRNLGNQLSGGEQQMLAVGARADPQSAHHAAGRAAGRAGADHHRGALGGDPQDRARGRPVGDPGRAERAARSSA